MNDFIPFLWVKQSRSESFWCERRQALLTTAWYVWFLIRIWKTVAWQWVAWVGPAQACCVKRSCH